MVKGENLSERFDSQKKVSGNFRQLLQEKIDKANPRRKLTAEEIKRLNKLETIADTLKRGKTVAKSSASDLVRCR